MSWLKSGIELPFTNGFGVSRSRANTAQECVNYRPNINSVGGLSEINLYQTEGVDYVLESFASGTCRGVHTMNGKPYFVIGTRLYRIDLSIDAELNEAWMAVNLGEIGGSQRVIMKSIWSGSGYEMAIVEPNFRAYSYREATGIVEDLSTRTNFLSPCIDVESVNGFMIFVQAGTNTVFHSELNDISTYPALAYETVTRVPEVKGLLKFRGQLFIMGEHDTLPYNFVGGINFAFQYQPNSTIAGGIVNQYAKTATGSNYFYLGGEDNETPQVIDGGGNRISNEQIEYIIRGSSGLSKCYMMNFSIDGGKYITLHIDNYCFVYDLNTGRWHNRNSRELEREAQWRVNNITKAYGRLIVGDSYDGRIGQLSNGDEEYGDNVHRYFVTQPFDLKGRFVSVKSLMVCTDSGFEGDLVMSYSDDGGYTWSEGSVRSKGSAGEYGLSVEWDCLGAADFSRVLRVGTSNAKKANINKVLVR